MELVPPERMPGERQLETQAEFESALDELIANAAHTVRIFDKALGRGFNTPRRYELLRNLLLGGRAHRVYIALHDTSNIVRDCPRLVSLLKQFSHALFIHQTQQAAKRIYDPFAIADDTRLLHRFHYTSLRSVAAVGDVAATRLLLKRFDEIWHESTPSVTATTIGL
jgi:hypothetical protein